MEELEVRDIELVCRLADLNFLVAALRTGRAGACTAVILKELASLVRGYRQSCEERARELLKIPAHVALKVDLAGGHVAIFVAKAWKESFSSN
jgi:hypothetical protein